MKLSQLRDVLAVSETGSLRAAGRYLGIAQPAITRSIREIEQELGATLFERHAKGVRMTEIGTAFVARAHAVQAEILRAKDEVNQLKGRLCGKVSLALSTASSMVLLPKALGEFRKRYPEATLSISETFFSPIERELLDGRTDLYVGPFEAGSTANTFIVEKLFDNQRRVVGRRGHPLAHARTFAELADAQWLRPATAERSTEGDFDESLAQFGLQNPNIVLQSRSALITMLTLASTDLLTVVPQQWIDSPITSTMIEAFDLPPFHAAPICILRRPDMPLTPMAEYLCDMMRRVGGHYAQRLDAALV
ncbi:LysR substrate-binding domain-containing protein [Novosphingobium sp.]|uniref:LysR substrate-binding domain-containing protein n=1 Tax=Novosphingobium sp. TaxID=1874826 RepID=UPI00286D8AEC|nr:LysR substrate-binding domain-containing protein [Novosphingobium sp.]